MNYLSVCSGISAATVAWRGLGWKPLAFCEIESFPSAVLKHHFPKVPNLGDMTKFEEWAANGIDLADADILEGGTPCQAWSWAGLRQSLKDARGSLALVYVKLLDYIDEKRNLAGRPPAICVWENVPGVLNTPDNAFGCFLGGLAGSDGPLEPPDPERGWEDAGYVHGPKRTIAWRCLDAQYLGLAQRRHRVFVIASAREGFNPGAVLFESEGVRRDSPPSRETGEGVAPTVRAGAANSGSGHGARSGDSKDELIVPVSGGLIPEIVGTLTDGAHNGGGLNGQDAYSGRIIPTLNRRLPSGEGREGSGQQHEERTPDPMHDTTHTLKGEGHDASEDGTGRGVPIIPVAGGASPMAFDWQSGGDARGLTPKPTAQLQRGQVPAVMFLFDETQITSPENRSNPQDGDPSHPLTSEGRPPTLCLKAGRAQRRAASEPTSTLRQLYRQRLQERSRARR